MGKLVKELTPEQRERKRARDRKRYWDNPQEFVAKNAAYRFKQRSRKARVEMLAAGMVFLGEKAA